MLQVKLPSQKKIKEGFSELKGAVGSSLCVIDTSYFSPPYTCTGPFRKIKFNGKGMEVFASLRLLNSPKTKGEVAENGNEARRFISDYSSCFIGFLEKTDFLIPDAVLQELEDKVTAYKLFMNEARSMARPETTSSSEWAEIKSIAIQQYQLAADLFNVDGFFEMAMEDGRIFNTAIARDDGKLAETEIRKTIRRLKNYMVSKRIENNIESKGVDETVVAVAVAKCMEERDCSILSFDHGLAHDLKRLYRGAEKNLIGENGFGYRLYKQLSTDHEIRVYDITSEFIVEKRTGTKKMR